MLKQQLNFSPLFQHEALQSQLFQGKKLTHTKIVLVKFYGLFLLLAHSITMAQVLLVLTQQFPPRFLIITGASLLQVQANRGLPQKLPQLQKNISTEYVHKKLLKTSPYRVVKQANSTKFNCAILQLEPLLLSSQRIPWLAFSFILLSHLVQKKK